MKRFFVFLAVILGLISCNQSKRIVTDVPIKTEILGVKLCEEMSISEVRYALMDHTDQYFETTTQKNGNVEIYRNVPTELNFNYGGLSWTYIDVGVTKDSEVYVLSLAGSYESEERAKQQYDSAVAIFTQKYGKGNAHDNLVFWTDNVNSVGLVYYKSSAINGSDRSFCELYYTNIALSDKVAAENQPDI